VYYVCKICEGLGRSHREYESRAGIDWNRRNHLWSAHKLSGMENARKFFKKVKEKTVPQTIKELAALQPVTRA
jgi:hypothetical protein